MVYETDGPYMMNKVYPLEALEAYFQRAASLGINMVFGSTRQLNVGDVVVTGNGIRLVIKKLVSVEEALKFTGQMGIELSGDPYQYEVTSD